MGKPHSSKVVTTFFNYLGSVLIIGLGCSSVVEHLPSMYRPAVTPSTIKTQKIYIERE
jgi:putative Mn2+ efflux pump MntP